MDHESPLGKQPPVDSIDGYFDRWSRLHGDVDPRGSWLVRGWLTIAYRCAKPLCTLGLSPNGVTVVGVAVSALVPLIAWVSSANSIPGLLWLAVFVTALSGLLDSLDGAVAVIGGRTSRGGYVLDSLADRISDAALLAALWLIGSPGILVAIAIFIGYLQEYARARATAAGVDEVGVVSISERPTRIVIVAVFVGLCAWAPYGFTTANWATYGAGVAAAVAAIGFGQVALALGHRLRQPRQA